ncbi:MAG: hypothetical protein J4G05_09610 [Chlorobi bacterium]|nr:hypothetical protein [Chlorobiota bacterium]
MRDIILRVAEETSRSGDHESTVLALEGALQRTPDDEEIVGYLSDVLSALGCRSHAEQIKRKLRREESW